MAAGIVTHASPPLAVYEGYFYPVKGHDPYRERDDMVEWPLGPATHPQSPEDRRGAGLRAGDIVGAELAPGTSSAYGIGV